MYKLTNAAAVIRLSDTAYIPSDPSNTDYLAYLEWLAAGNTPEPPEEPTEAQIQANINLTALNYLASTDWYVIRNQETGEPIPDSVLELRAAARLQVIT